MPPWLLKAYDVELVELVYLPLEVETLEDGPVVIGAVVRGTLALELLEIVTMVDDRLDVMFHLVVTVVFKLDLMVLDEAKTPVPVGPTEVEVVPLP